MGGAGSSGPKPAASCWAADVDGVVKARPGFADRASVKATTSVSLRDEKVICVGENLRLHKIRR